VLNIREEQREESLRGEKEKEKQRKSTMAFARMGESGASATVSKSTSSGVDKATIIENALARHGSTLIANGNADGTKKSSEKATQRNHEEYQYLDLIRDILDNGEHRPDRFVAPSSSPPPLRPHTTISITSI